VVLRYILQQATKGGRQRKTLDFPCFIDQTGLPHNLEKHLSRSLNRGCRTRGKPLILFPFVVDETVVSLLGKVPLACIIAFGNDLDGKLSDQAVRPTDSKPQHCGLVWPRMCLNEKLEFEVT
jgi:hypothetical protein